jgi:hypothetical protein
MDARPSFRAMKRHTCMWSQFSLRIAAAIGASLKVAKEGQSRAIETAANR